MFKMKSSVMGVSPVIATILMVSVTVVLAAVLYVLVIGMPSDTGNADVPIGFVQQTGRNSTTVTMLIASTPSNANIESSSMYLLQDESPAQVNATIYEPTGVPFGNYTNNAWDINENYDINFKNGMIIKVTAAKLTHGDKVVMTGDGQGTTTFTVN